MRRALLVVAGALGALLSVAAPAAADTNMALAGGILYWRSDDAGIPNALTVDNDARNRVRFVDEADPYGMRYPTPKCQPGRLNSAGNTVEVFCERGGYSSITVESGPGEDRVSYELSDLPLSAAGADGADTFTSLGTDDSLSGQQGNDTLDSGAGNDRLAGGDGDDTIRAGDGNDRVDGGTGADVIDAGAGDDEVIAADGVAETIDCGPGADRINADPGDRLVNCETEARQEVAPPPVAAQRGGVEDDAHPVLEIGGSTSQRVSLGRRRVRIAVTASERAIVNASGFLDAGGINRRLRPVSARVTTAGGGTYVNLTLTRAMARSALRDIRRHRRPRVQLVVSAVDAAGNTSPPRRLTIRLRR